MPPYPAISVDSLMERARMARDYASQEVKAELQGVKDTLAGLTEKYVAAVSAVTALDNQEYTDFMARRLVEMAGNLVMSYLLLSDANRNNGFSRTLNVYVKMAEAEIAKHTEFIANFKPEQLEFYRM